MFYKQTPVKITGNGLAAGRQVFYRKIYGLFFTVCVLTKVIIRLFASDNFTIRPHNQWPSCHKWCKCWLYGHKSPSLFYILSNLIKSILRDVQTSSCHGKIYGKKYMGKQFLPGQGKVIEFEVGLTERTWEKWEIQGKFNGYGSLQKNVYPIQGKKDVLSRKLVQAHLPPHLGLFLEERICSLRSKFFPLRVTPNYKWYRQHC